MVATILLIGESKSTIVDPLREQYRVFTVRSGKQGLQMAGAHPPQVIVIDACSMRTSGERICRRLRLALPDARLVHIHPGPVETAHSDADVLLFAPVTQAMLKAQVQQCIQPQIDERLECGPFRMDTAQRILFAHGKQTRLTPMQARLVEMFLRNPGQTMERKTLMEEVWNTKYLGDTRTLDVHIRWIRQIIEEDGSKPRYLKTVRGVGYRLVVPDIAN